MSVEVLDTVLLKDGREAVIVEKFSDEVFLGDIGVSPMDWDTVDIRLDDIEKVLERHHK